MDKKVIYIIVGIIISIAIIIALYIYTRKYPQETQNIGSGETTPGTTTIVTEADIAASREFERRFQQERQGEIEAQRESRRRYEEERQALRQAELSKQLSRPTTRRQVDGKIVPVPDPLFDEYIYRSNEHRLSQQEFDNVKQQAQQTRDTQERERVDREVAAARVIAAAEQARKQEEKRNLGPGWEERQAQLANIQLAEERARKAAQEQYEREAPQRAAAAMRALQEEQFQRDQAEQNQRLAQMSQNQAEQLSIDEINRRARDRQLSPEELRQREIDRQQAVLARATRGQPGYLRHLRNKNYLYY